MGLGPSKSIGFPEEWGCGFSSNVNRIGLFPMSRPVYDDNVLKRGAVTLPESALGNRLESRHHKIQEYTCMAECAHSIIKTPRNSRDG
jgi:hypothetical protein